MPFCFQQNNLITYIIGTDTEITEKYQKEISKKTFIRFGGRRVLIIETILYKTSVVVDGGFVKIVLFRFTKPSNISNAVRNDIVVLVLKLKISKSYTCFTTLTNKQHRKISGVRWRGRGGL